MDHEFNDSIATLNAMIWEMGVGEAIELLP